MSPQSASNNAVASVKSESSYKSPPSSLSDLSQHDTESSRGRRQDRERSMTAKADEDSCDDKENGAEASANGKPRKRKRSRKGLEKNFPCSHQGCCKSYSRAEHLYRHQLNREFLFSSFWIRYSTTFDKTPRYPEKNLHMRFPGLRAAVCQAGLMYSAQGTAYRSWLTSSKKGAIYTEHRWSTKPFFARG